MARISKLKNKSTEGGSVDVFSGVADNVVKTDVTTGIVDATLLPPIPTIGETTPVAGTAIVPVPSALPHTRTVAWGQASDVGGTQTTSLKYRVVLSAAPITDINEAMRQDNWQCRWSRDLTTIDLYGLSANTTYFATVFVKNWDENTAMYASVSFTTGATVLTTYYVDPTAIAGAGLGVFAAGEAETVAGLTLGVDIFNTLFDALTVSEAAANPAGATILLSNGTHEINDAAPSLLIQSPTNIIGLDKNRTLLQNTGLTLPLSPSLEPFISNQVCMIVFDDVAGDCTVANFRIDGGGTAGNLNYGVWGVGVNLVVANLFVDSVRRNTGYRGQGIAHTTDGVGSTQPAKNNFFTLLVQNNTISSAGRQAIRATLSAPGAEFKWNTAYGIGSLDVELEHGLAQDTVDNLDVSADALAQTEGKGDYVGYGFEVSSIQNALITENEINDMQGMAGDGSQSGGIYFYNWGDWFGGDLENNLSSAVIRYNDINNCTVGFIGGVVAFAGMVQLPHSPQDVTFQGNVINSSKWLYERAGLGPFDITNNYWGEHEDLEKPRLTGRGSQLGSEDNVQIYPAAKTKQIETI